MAKILKISGALLLVLIATYMGAHYWIRWKNTVHDDVTKLGRLAECEPHTIRRISITQVVGGNREDLEFERVDQQTEGVPAVASYAQAEWRFVKPARGEADTTLLRRIASTVCELYDPILIRPGELDMGTGSELDHRLAAALDVELAGKNGKTEKLKFEFGRIGNDRLVMVSLKGPGDQEKAARIPAQLLQASSFSPENYQSLQVMRTHADNIQTATLLIDGKERFTLERLGADWKLIEKGKDKGAASEEANKFVNRVATLKGLEVLDPSYGADRCRAGNAKAILQVSGVAGREESVRFDYGRAGDIAACSTSRTMKFRVHRDLLRYLDISAKSLARK